MLPWPDAMMQRTRSVIEFFNKLGCSLTLLKTLTAPRPLVRATCLDSGRARYIPLSAPSSVEVMKVEVWIPGISRYAHARRRLNNIIILDRLQLSVPPSRRS